MKSLTFSTLSLIFMFSINLKAETSKVSILEDAKVMFKSVSYAVSNGEEMIPDFLGEESLHVKLKCNTHIKVCQIIKFHWGEKDGFNDDLSYDYSEINKMKLHYDNVKGEAAFYSEGNKVGKMTLIDGKQVVQIKGIDALDYQNRWPVFRGKVLY